MLGVVGELALDYEAMVVAAGDGLMISVHSAEPASHVTQALELIASWIATVEYASTHPDE